MYILFCICWIIPVTDDMETFRIGIYPAVPHHLMCIIPIFRNPHSVYFTTSTIVLFTSIMCIGVGENNIHTARTDTFSRSRTNFPIFPPAANRLHGMLILISVVVAGVVAFIQGPFSLLMERIGKFIPVFTQTFIAHVLGSNHRMLSTFIDIEHLSTVLGQLAIQHFT